MVKPVTDFYVRKGKGRGTKPASYCKSCYADLAAAQYQKTKAKRDAQMAAWRAANREKWNAYSQNWYRNNPRTATNTRIKKRYGITIDDYESLIAAQGDACAICGGHERNGTLFSVDHDHDTGKVRGLLCRTCNAAIGLFQERIDLIESALSYLRRGGTAKHLSLTVPPNKRKLPVQDA